MSNIYILIIILIAILVFLYFLIHDIKRYIQENYSELVVNFIIIILSVLIGANLALRNTMQINKSDEIKNYLSMLNSCKHINQQYMDIVKDIVDSLNSNSQNLSDLDRLIKSANQPIILEELLRKSDLYDYASTDFKNWLPRIISFLRATDWTISKENLSIYKFNYQYLTYIKDLITNEESYINEDLSEEEIKTLNYKLREKFDYSTSDIKTKDIIIEQTKSSMEDTLNREREYYK